MTKKDKIALAIMSVLIIVFGFALYMSKKEYDELKQERDAHVELSCGVIASYDEYVDKVERVGIESNRDDSDTFKTMYKYQDKYCE